MSGHFRARRRRKFLAKKHGRAANLGKKLFICFSKKIFLKSSWRDTWIGGVFKVGYPKENLRKFQDFGAEIHDLATFWVEILDKKLATKVPFPPAWAFSTCFKLCITLRAVVQCQGQSSWGKVDKLYLYYHSYRNCGSTAAQYAANAKLTRVRYCWR